MNTKRAPYLVTLSASLMAIWLPHLAQSQNGARQDLLKGTEAEQTTWINAHLCQGLPPSDEFVMLVLNRSSVALPLIESKIEEVLHSASPAGCFTDKSVEPEKFVDRAAVAITEAGNVESLRQASKLIKIDESRFGKMVRYTLVSAQTRRNPFGLAYQGLELGDPGIETRIVAWVQAQLAEGKYSTPGGAEAETLEVRRWLAEALVERYGSAPTEPQWWADPLISRLPPPQATWMHDDVMRLASEAARKRAKL